MSDATQKLDRRDILRGLGAAGALAGLAPLYPRAAAAADKLVVGVIYVGPRDDYGYNQAQAQAAAAIKKMPGVSVVEQEKVPETTDVQKTMGSMIEQDGATLLFPTSFGYFDPHILRMAEKYPKVRFAHCGGLGRRKHPKCLRFGYTTSASTERHRRASTSRRSSASSRPSPSPGAAVINAFTWAPAASIPRSPP
jgi:basic membrane lipoprotein Med (substrate-binding protein (PBP1-ABC) superfamily)